MHAYNASHSRCCRPYGNSTAIGNGSFGAADDITDIDEEEKQEEDDDDESSSEDVKKLIMYLSNISETVK